jgi:DNA invertase Pin-like site-specific DNA recombinase
LPQFDVLQSAGRQQTFRDAASGAKADRLGLAQGLELVRAGGTLVVWRLDRLGRCLFELNELMTRLDERGVCFKSLTEQIDTTTSGGKLIFHTFGALAEFERNLIRERTMAGPAAARARDRLGGRPKLPDTDCKIQMARKLHGDPSNSISDICKTLGVSRATLYRYLGVRHEAP